MVAIILVFLSARLKEGEGKKLFKWYLYLFWDMKEGGSLTGKWK
jgi:hypothetical protein